MTQPGVIGAWSVKDVLAHIVVHEQRTIQWTTDTLRGATPVAPQPYDMPEAELTEANERVYRENRGRPLDDVLREFEKTRARVLTLVETAGEEDLIDPRRFRLREGEPLRAAIVANTFPHYEEHSRDIRAWQVNR